MSTLMFIALWAVVILEFCLILALAKQLGTVLAKMGGPSSALVTEDGLLIGERAPQYQLSTFDGQILPVGGAAGRLTLLLFVSTTCSTCSKIIPGLKTLARNEKGLDLNILVIARGDDAKKHESYHKMLVKDGIPYIANTEIFEKFRFSAVPYALLLDEGGVVRAKGISNNLDHLESILLQYEMEQLEQLPQAAQAVN